MKAPTIGFLRKSMGGAGGFHLSGKAGLCFYFLSRCFLAEYLS